MDVKNEVLYRVYFLLFGMVIPAAIVLIYRTIDIAIIDGERWRAEGQDSYVREREIEAERGNILATDGSLLATSVPFFDIYFDPYAPSEEDFQKNVDSLAYCMATYVDRSYTVGGMRQFLAELRDTNINRNRHILIKKQATYTEKKRIEQFPLFNLGKYKGGLIAEKRSERKRPFGLLARRTIGYVRADAQPIGLEGYYDDILGGQPGKEFMVCVDRKHDLWIPTEDLTSIEPKSGDDIVTTIDVNIQDITENALLRALQYHNADWGTAVVMEVKTGAIRAIANLGKNEEGWFETYNYAIGFATEPGSTFKLASMMALLEDNLINLEDSVSIEHGVTQYYEEVLEDSSPESKELDTITVRKAFEMSSNVGVSKLVTKAYGERNSLNGNEGAARYIAHMKEFNLHLPTGIDIEGEAAPYIKEAYSEKDSWSGTTLPWMSIGYESRITPLQLLTFYNAVANNGEMMKPMLVEEIRRFGHTQQSFKPTVIKRRIASKRTIQKAKELLEGVVLRGTAAKLATDQYRFAGKTGTAQLNYRRRRGGGNTIGGYQASFVGYFPAEAPMYSCIVMINRPRQHGIYGSDVAGPVFREIADKCYYSIVELHDPLNNGPRPVLAGANLPGGNAGNSKELLSILDFLELPYYGTVDGEMAVVRAQSDSLIIENRRLPEDKVPSVIGMGLRDALYALENRGLRVRISGVGKVVSQSVMPGTRARGQTVAIRLN